MTPPPIGSQTLALLNAVLSNAPFGFAVLDTDLRYLHVNELLARVNGKTPQEHRGPSPLLTSAPLWRHSSARIWSRFATPWSR